MTKPSDAKALEMWGMWSTLSLLLLLGPLWPRVIAPNGILSMDQIEQILCLQMTDVKLWLLYSNTWNHLTVCKKELRLVLRMLSPKCVYKSYIHVCVCVCLYIYTYIYIYIYTHTHKQNLALSNLQWLICRKTPPNHTKFWSDYNIFDDKACLNHRI